MDEFETLKSLLGKGHEERVFVLTKFQICPDLRVFAGTDQVSGKSVSKLLLQLVSEEGKCVSILFSGVTQFECGDLIVDNFGRLCISGLEIEAVSDWQLENVKWCVRINENTEDRFGFLAWRIESAESIDAASNEPGYA